MAGTITTDLTLIDAADATTNWATIGTWAVAPLANADMVIQGTNCILGKVSGAGAEGFDEASRAATDMSINQRHFFIWVKTDTWASMDTRANGGVRICMSSDPTPTLAGTAPLDGPSNGKVWFVGGSDTDTTTGWVCYVVNPMSTPDVTQGTPTMTGIQRFGLGFRVTKTIGSGAFKPDPHMFDAANFGTGLIINNGTSSTPVTFKDIFAADGGTVTNSWGVFTQVSGIYYLAGKLMYGTSGQTAVTYFQDTNQVIVCRPFPVANTFYELITAGASSFTTTFQLGTYANNVASNGCTIRGSNGLAYTPPGAPTVAVAAGAGLNIGTYKYKITFINGVGETVGGTESANVTTTSGNQQVSLSAIPTGPASITARNVYRTLVGGASGSELFVAQIANNTATTYTDSIADTSLGRPVPTVDTSAGSAWTLTGNAANTITNLYASTFAQMRRGSLNSSSSMRSCVISGSGELTPNGAVVDSCTFSSVMQQPPISGTYALIINATSELAAVTNNKFISCNRAIQINAAGTYTSTGNTFSGNNYDIENTVSGTDAVSQSDTRNTDQALGNGTITGIGESFVGNGAALANVVFTLSKSGSPTGNLTAKVYAHSGTYGTSSVPTGTALAASAILDVSTLTTTPTATTIFFSLQNQNITLTNSTNYVVTLEYSAGNASNYVNVGIDNSSPTWGGNFSTYNGTSWTAVSGTDAIFKVRTGGIVIINPLSGSNPTLTLNSAAIPGCTTVNTGVNLTAKVIDPSQNVITGAEVRFSKTSGNDDIGLVGTTDVNGLYTVNTTTSPGTGIAVTVRLSVPAGARYLPVTNTATMPSVDTTYTITLTQDTIAL